jgi:pyruvate kinase
MPEDVLETLENMAYIIRQCEGKAQVVLTSPQMLEDAAEEIRHLRAKVDALLVAVHNELDEPRLSYTTIDRHRKELPEVWDAIYDAIGIRGR